MLLRYFSILVALALLAGCTRTTPFVSPVSDSESVSQVQSMSVPSVSPDEGSPVSISSSDEGSLAQLPDQNSQTSDQLRIMYQGQELTDYIVLKNYVNPNALDTTIQIPYILTRYDNVVCMSIQDFPQDVPPMPKDKVGCIEFIDGKDGITVGAFDADNDGYPELFTKLGVIQNTSRQYIAYNCEGCAPGADFSWVQYISIQ